MKKYILLLVFTLTSLICLGQDKIVKIPQSELDAFFLAVDTLELQDSLKTVLITDLEFQIVNLKDLNKNCEDLVLNKANEIILLNDQIKLYDDRLKIADRWYNKRWFGIVIGVAGTSTAIYLAGQIN